MQEIQATIRENERQDIKFKFPIQTVAYALDVSPEELIRAAAEDKIGYRKVTEHKGSVVIQIRAYARHCTVTAERSILSHFCEDAVL